MQLQDKGASQTNEKASMTGKNVDRRMHKHKGAQKQSDKDAELVGNESRRLVKIFTRALTCKVADKAFRSWSKS